MRRALLGLLVAGAPLQAQDAEPLRKGRLVRLLTDPAVTRQQVAALISRNCLSFTPTWRDRADLRALGADTDVFGRIDDCVRRAGGATAARPPAPAPAVSPLAVVLAPGRVTATTGGEAVLRATVTRAGRPAAGVGLVLGGAGAQVRAQSDGRGVATFRVPAGAAPGTRQLTVAAADNQPLTGQVWAEFVVTAAPAAPVSAARTGFVSGGGQRGRVGTRLPQPLVFEVRDANGAPMAGRQVAFAATNARLDAERATTDAAGQVRLAVALGSRTGPASVTATVGEIRRQVTLTALAGPAARIVLACGRAAPAGPITIGTGGPALVRVAVQDALGNPLAVTGLRVAVGDEGVLRVTGSAGGDTEGSVTLQPGRAGSTSVSVFASGVRENHVIAVARGGPVCQ